MTALPLAGCRILVTRAAHQAGKLSNGLSNLGAQPIEVPVLEILPPTDPEALDAGLRALPCYDWLIFTSANTVSALVHRAAELGLALAQPAGLKVAAIGAATAEAARQAGFQITFVPEAYVAESLSSGLTAITGRHKILLARAEIARDVIPESLRAAGAEVDVVDAYRNVMPESAPGQLRRALSAGVDAAAFTSSSSATHLAEAARAAGIAWPFAAVSAISIGPITTATLRESGWEPAAEAGTSDIPGLLAAVVQWFSRT